MKTKAKSVQDFEVRIWSDKHYNTKRDNIYHGLITDAKSKKKVFFHTAGDLLKAVEKLYKLAEN